MGTKKPADPGGRADARGEPGGFSQGWSVWMLRGGDVVRAHTGNGQQYGRSPDARYRTYGDELYFRALRRPSQNLSSIRLE